MDLGKIVYPGLAALFTALVFYVLGIVNKAPTLIIPSKAVMAFNLLDCPDGWTEFKEGESRFIVGWGQSAGLSRYALGQVGGVEGYILSEAQMPRHQHNTPQAMNDLGPNFGLGPERKSVFGANWANGTTEMTSWSGGDAPVGNLPPFIALKLCMKQ